MAIAALRMIPRQRAYARSIVVLQLTLLRVGPLQLTQRLVIGLIEIIQRQEQAERLTWLLIHGGHARVAT